MLIGRGLLKVVRVLIVKTPSMWILKESEKLVGMFIGGNFLLLSHRNYPKGRLQSMMNSEVSR
jgi:hypothetical protein